MKAQFEIRTFLTANKEMIVARYNALSNNTCFSGISLKEFMILVMRNMEVNEPKSEKRAASLLESIVEGVCNKNIMVANDTQRKPSMFISTPNQLPSSMR